MTAGKTDARLIGAAGAGFFVLAMIGRLAYPSEPEFVGEAGSIVAFYEGNEDALIASNAIYLVGMALLLAFVGALCNELRRSAPVAAAVALVGGVAGTTLMLASGAADAVAALRVAERATIEPAVATVLWDLNMILFGLAAPIAFATLVLAVATATLRAAVLSRWIGWVSLPLGVALLVPPINYIAMIVFLFWIPAVAAAWVLHARTASAGAGTRTADAVGAAG